MRQIWPSLFILTISVKLLSIGNASAQIIISDDWTGSEFAGVRHWSLVNPSRSRVQIRGTIYRMRWWDCWYCDGDLNMLIRPRPEDAFVSTNGEGRLNRSEGRGEFTDADGLIEIEINTNKVPFDSAFASGMNVVAKGWWVEDSGHRSKTELHPLMVLIGSHESDPLEADIFTVFIGQDSSGRFPVAGEFYQQHLDIAIASEADVVRPDRGEIGSLAKFGYASETSSLDEYSALVDDTYRVIHRQYPEAPVLQVIINLPPAWLLKPAYVAQFSRATLPGFNDNARYGIVMLAGQKAVEISVAPEFTNEVLVSSRWILEDLEAPGGLRIVNNPSPRNRVNLTMRYSPALGLSQAKWVLSGAGDSQGPGYVPTDTVRKYVHKTRTYEIKPSSLRLDGQWLRAGLEASEGQPQMAAAAIVECGRDESHTAVEELLPQIGIVPGTLQWTAKLNTGSGPQVIPPISPTIVTVNQAHDTAHVRVTVDPQNDHRLKVEWKVQDLFTSNASVQIAVAARTELGEDLYDELINAARCVPQDIDGITWVESLHKGILSMYRFRERTLVGSLRDRLAGSTEVHFDALRNIDIEEWTSKQPTGSQRDELEAFAAYSNAQTLTEAQAAALNRLADRGRTIRWSKSLNRKDLDNFIAEYVKQASAERFNRGFQRPLK